MRVTQLLKPSAVDTSAFNDLPPRHKEVVNDFYNQVDYDNKDVVKEVEKTIDVVSSKHNVNTDVMYNYINKEVGE
jgi:hypothetical protein